MFRLNAVMKRLIFVSAGLACGVVMLMGQTTHDLTGNPAEEHAEINFGSLHPQPPAPASHVLLPDEVTIFKQGTVNFIVNGAAHGIAIYEVSKNTTREDIAEDLCQGGPTACNGTTGTGALPYTVTDGNGDIIMATGTNPPFNGINSLPGQLFSAGIGVRLTGSTPTTAGTEVRYRFEKSGRYLVVCINRAHYLNDWMFGFVNVQG